MRNAKLNLIAAAYVLLFVFLNMLSFKPGDSYAADKPKPPCAEGDSLVPFAKVMHEAYAEEYTKCIVKTEAEFYASGKGMWVSKTLSDKKFVVIRALPPGEKGQKNPLSGEISANFIMIPKDLAGDLFNYKQGDLMTLTGYTKVNGGMGFTEVVFFAESVKKK